MTDYNGALGSQYTLRLVVTLSGQNTAANQSTLAWALYAIKNSGSGYFSGSPTPWSVNIGGVGYSGNVATYNFASYSSLLLASGSTTLTHNPDGSLSPTVSAYYDPDNAPAFAAGSAGGTFPLPDIPRGPRVEVSGAWQQSICYVEQGGAWVPAIVYVEQGGAWVVAS